MGFPLLLTLPHTELEKLNIYCPNHPAESLDLIFPKMNALRYQEMIRDFLWLGLDGIEMDNATFNNNLPHQQRNDRSFKRKVALNIGKTQFADLIYALISILI
uniref:Uncharacterized protein n=1 Tax=Ceratitis capitata TaxID=7213 RepID=W8AE12_CERCA